MDSIPQPTCYLAPSAVQGIGVFSWFPIAKGQPIFPYDAVEDCVLITDPLPEGPLKVMVTRYGVETKEGIWVPSDFNRMGVWWFLNHSSEPNVEYVGNDIVAARDLAAGEELTIDYRTLDADYSNLDF
jgi:SET domain-containing protein